MIALNRYNGILNVLKPPGMTSFDVVAYLRRILHEKKIGHAGTLDPSAVGVLPMCIGRATKAIEYMMDKNKSYRVELTLGISTDTQDSDGKIINKQKVELTHKEIEDSLNYFTGTTTQVPPMYSAIRVEGKRLYELARAGINIERKPREVQIFSSKIIKINNNKVIFDVVCSKGTYMRTLCSDIGDRLGCGGHMSFLIRTRAGVFNIHDALTLEEIDYLASEGKLSQKLINTGEVFNHLQIVKLNETVLKKFLNGVPVEINDLYAEECELIKIHSTSDEFIAIGEAITLQGQTKLKMKKLF